MKVPIRYPSLAYIGCYLAKEIQDLQNATFCIQERPNSSKICHGTKAETDEPEEVYHYGHSQSRFGSEIFTESGLDTWTIIPYLNAAPLRPLDAQYNP